MDRRTDRLIADADRLLTVLFPLYRSLSGPGTRRTLEVLAEVAPFDVAEVASGTQCFDWTVPDEWAATEAWIEVAGRRVVDLADSNLHLVGYSTPIDAVLTLAELRPHLHGLPDSPDAIPYRTSYYARNWGFCLPQRTIDALDPRAEYHVRIVAEHRRGSIPVGERALAGEEGADEFLFTTYACHPSLANDNLSGPVLWALLLRELAGRTLRNTYRFVIAPETIGIIAWLDRAQRGVTAPLDRVRGGYVLGSVAGPDGFSYKPSFLSLDDRRACIDRAAGLHT
jgi:aminopeptidase-like protein